MGRVIAIDGPAGAGKSTISRLLAKRIGFTYLDTGAMYRALTFFMLEHGLPAEDPAVKKILDGLDISLSEGAVFINGRDVSVEIRAREVDRKVSAYSALSEVRKFLTNQQRIIGARSGIVAEGRDMGSVVFPDAFLKVFLVASPEERARRRFIELEGKGLPGSYDDILSEIKERDSKDSSRVLAPLLKANDAIEVDTTELTIDAVLDDIYALFLEREKNK